MPSSDGARLAAEPTAPADPISIDAAITCEARAVDLRFGFAPLPAARPGYDPAGDARALMLPSLASPAREPVGGVQYTGSYAADERFVIRVPDRWNGTLIVAGTPATRSEFASDLVWGDYALANGYAFAASNKGVASNATLELAGDVADRRSAYPVPFDSGGLLSAGVALRFGMLWPKRIPIDAWNADYRALVGFARELLGRRHAVPARVYAVGLSNGGAQVRTLLEAHPELVDGGVEWAGVYWSAQHNLLDELPAFLRELPDYIRSGFRDPAAVDRLTQLGFPRDAVQADPAHPSLYAEYYSNVPPFYCDLTLFAYALLIDPEADASYELPACIADPIDPQRLPAVCNGTGLAVPANRARYTPSAAARSAIARFAHTGKIGKPLVSIAGTHDVLITPENHAVAYARAVERAGCGALHELFLVAGGTHVDTFAAFGYGLQPQAPFAWAAFERLVQTVEGSRSARGGTIQTVRTPGEIA